MNRFSRILFRIARSIAGRHRAEWIDAMAAEAASIDGYSAGWAMGCLWAAMKDRLARDWWFVAAIPLLSALASLWKGVVFFSTSSLLADHRIAPWFAVTLWILSPFPIAFLFGQIRRGLSLYVALFILSGIAEFGPFLLMWIKFGLSPVTFFSGQHVNWYKADPNVRIGPPAGITLDVLVWLGGAWLGSDWRRPPKRPPING